MLAKPGGGAYRGGMSIGSGILLFLATVALMEGWAYVAHRWIMHGPGWFLHKSHHAPRTGFWELNDLYFVIFAAPSITLLVMGTSGAWGEIGSSSMPRA